MQKILIIGATSAIASACARRWASSAAVFFLVGRNAEKLEQVAADLSARNCIVHSHVLDANCFDRHGAMLDACYAALEEVDIALIAHGTLPQQKACEVDPQLLLAEFGNNALSVMAVLTDLAARMETRKHGRIAVISSVAGDRGRASNYVYGAAKSAVSVFCSGLRARLHGSGVHLMLIKPGFVDTPMTQGLALPAALLSTPDKVAKDVVAALEKNKDTLYTPWFWRVIMLLIIHIPGPVFKRLRL